MFLLVFFFQLSFVRALLWQVWNNHNTIVFRTDLSLKHEASWIVNLNLKIIVKFLPANRNGLRFHETQRNFDVIDCGLDYLSFQLVDLDVPVQLVS